MIKMSCTLLALDTSSTKTGYAVYVDGKYQGSGVVISKENKKRNKKQDMMYRLNHLIEKINPDIIVIETPTVTRNAKTQRILTSIYGAVESDCIVREAFFYEMTPSTWRKNTNISAPKSKGKKPNREEWKAWSVECVKTLFPKYRDITDDEADAVLIGLAYINLMNLQNSKNKRRKKTVKVS